MCCFPFFFSSRTEYLDVTKMDMLFPLFPVSTALKMHWWIRRTNYELPYRIRDWIVICLFGIRLYKCLYRWRCDACNFGFFTEAGKGNDIVYKQTFTTLDIRYTIYRRFCVLFCVLIVLIPCSANSAIQTRNIRTLCLTFSRFLHFSILKHINKDFLFSQRFNILS